MVSQNGIGVRLAWKLTPHFLAAHSSRGCISALVMHLWLKAVELTSCVGEGPALEESKLHLRWNSDGYKRMQFINSHLVPGLRTSPSLLVLHSKSIIMSSWSHLCFNWEHMLRRTVTFNWLKLKVFSATIVNAKKKKCTFYVFFSCNNNISVLQMV